MRRSLVRLSKITKRVRSITQICSRSRPGKLVLSTEIIIHLNSSGSLRRIRKTRRIRRALVWKSRRLRLSMDQLSRTLLPRPRRSSLQPKLSLRDQVKLLPEITLRPKLNTNLLKASRLWNAPMRDRSALASDQSTMENKLSPSAKCTMISLVSLILAQAAVVDGSHAIPKLSTWQTRLVDTSASALENWLQSHSLRQSTAPTTLVWASATAMVLFITDSDSTRTTVLSLSPRWWRRVGLPRCPMEICSATRIRLTATLLTVMTSSVSAKLTQITPLLQLLSFVQMKDKSAIATVLFTTVESSAHSMEASSDSLKWKRVPTFPDLLRDQFSATTLSSVTQLSDRRSSASVRKPKSKKSRDVLCKMKLALARAETCSTALLKSTEFSQPASMKCSKGVDSLSNMTLMAITLAIQRPLDLIHTLVRLCNVSAMTSNTKTESAFKKPWTHGTQKLK